MDTTNILLVDDEVFHIQIERAILGNRKNCHLLEAHGGIEALNIVTEEHPDLVLMDLHMPDMDGDECCNIIKRDSDLKDIPIVMLSSAEGSEKEQCIAAGCDDYITKPINRREFLSKVNAYTGLPIRKYIRIPFDADAYFKFDKKRSEGSIVNISAGGLLMQSHDALPVGSVTEISFSIESIGDTMAEGEVVRIDDNFHGSKTESQSAFGMKKSNLMVGIGIKFINISEEVKEAIEKL